MNITPDITKVRSLITQADDIVYLTRGGFKSVYKTTINNSKEVVKFVFIPFNPTDPEVKAENISRIQREVEILTKIKTPSLVKIGSLKPIEEDIDGNCYFIYSEEFLDGEDLHSLIKKNYSPNQKELNQLCL
tara:strand:- start:2548 stop:2943 length:396 start_codon:yes stop_codon:yes gene_type:complete